MNNSAIAIFLIFIGLPVSAQDTTPSMNLSIDSLFLDYDRADSPGCAIAIIQDGEVIYKKSFGQANLEYDIPITSNTIFNVGSIAKQFTAFAILLLEQEGKVSQDDDIRKYLPEIPDFGKVITPRHLLYHISGLREQFALFKIAGIGFDDVITGDQLIKLYSLQKELNFDPGNQFMYCNTGYAFLAEIVSRVSGQSFPDFMKMNIFDSLKMDNTFFLEDHEQIIAGRAYSYFQENTPSLKQRRLNYSSSGGSNLYSNIEDLALWLMNLEATKKGLIEMIAKLYETTKLNNGTALNYASGMELGKYKNLKLIDHYGGIWGYKSYMCRFPEHKLGIVVLSNLSSFNPEEKAMRIANIILKNQIQDVPDITQNQEIRTIKISTEELNEFCGFYWVKEAEYSREIYLKNGQLTYKRGPENESVLAPFEKNRFRMLDVAPKVDVYFMRGENALNMLVEIDDGDPIVSEKYDPVLHTEENLLKYAGTYFCEELQTTYQIEVKNNTLVTHHIRNDDIILVPSQVPNQLDRFDADPWWFRKVTFYSEDGVIQGFTVDTDRIRNLKFRRVDA